MSTGRRRTDHGALIRGDVACFRDLHETVKATFLERDKSPEHREAWNRACRAFHQEELEMYAVLDRIGRDGIGTDPDLRRFVFAYIDTDPQFFRSGYILERLLRRIKRLTLTEAEKAALRALILRRIHHRAWRNFRDICRLIPRIQTQEFRASVWAALRDEDPGVRHRATLALSYLV